LLVEEARVAARVTMAFHDHTTSMGLVIRLSRVCVYRGILQAILRSGAPRGESLDLLVGATVKRGAPKGLQFE
jgi:hypothetical protein